MSSKYMQFEHNILQTLKTDVWYALLHIVEQKETLQRIMGLKKSSQLKKGKAKTTEKYLILGWAGEKLGIHLKMTGYHDSRMLKFCA